MQKSILSVLLLLLVVMSVRIDSAAAKTNDLLGCDRALSTSALQTCLKKRLEQAQIRLKKAYAELDKQFDTPEKRNELKDLQQTWLRYRDQECMWEGQQASVPGLKNIQEISCMVRVSNDRAELLEITYMDVDPDVSRDFANTSRWKNLINTKYNNILWDTKFQEEADLNCDAAEEIILQGTAFSKVKGIEKEGVALYEQEQVVAVVTNPAIGTPEATLFTFKFSEDDEKLMEENDVLCNSRVKVTFVAAPENVSEEQKQAESCAAQVTISQNKCEDKIIRWDGKDFVLQESEAQAVEETE